MDKTYGEKIYGISYDIPPDDIVSEIKHSYAKQADTLSDLMEGYLIEASKEGSVFADLMVKVDYLIRALERLEESSFLAVKSQFI